MIRNKSDLLREEAWRGVGAEVVATPHEGGLRSGLRLHFEGFRPEEGPQFYIKPSGLSRHLVSIEFGKFAKPCIVQMQGASLERLEVARALIRQIATANEVSVAPQQNLDDWSITSSDFSITVSAREIVDPQSDRALSQTAQSIIVPLMAAMAELIGYDHVEEEAAEFDEEGRLLESVVKRRERSPRNRLLCLSIHGKRCAVCQFSPPDLYGAAGDIIEVHHIEPVGQLEAPRRYNPATDLIPLCPNCHRALHTHRPVPLLPDDLRTMLQT
ncbi:5-methylcytosine-specific restriction protein A [Sphingomonas sp. PP-F2F-A104-K0414]|uniref:HNH endonuclease n=1 Tax=Sphingomonas sp. PP-F2F-A104-K0414 TaxID=2135661 RepID=UPI001047DAC4|nr:HNH endonuclease [Sphingomonas sp. PP-F2F-A104-K0414]TCP99545.1 5-methylcytosine-specific restriction protein A [Sphingomonas sp. PP-F2F-A104-K0414]